MQGSCGGVADAFFTTTACLEPCSSIWAAAQQAAEVCLEVQRALPRKYTHETQPRRHVCDIRRWASASSHKLGSLEQAA